MPAPAAPRAAFALLAAVGVALLAQAIPAVNVFISHETCLESTGSPALPFLNYGFNQALCAFNVTFSAAYATVAGQHVLGAFGAFFLAPAFILLHSSGAVRGALLLLLGQVVPVCIVYPAYGALSAPRTADRREEPWQALLATVGGYLVPGVYAVRSGLAYGPLSAWQIYPVYTLLIAVACAPFAFSGAKRVAYALAGAVCVGTSLSAQLPLLSALIAGEFSAADAFWPSQSSFAGAALWIFVVDFAVVVVASLVLVAPKSVVGWAGLLATSAALGPGAAVILFWLPQVW
ncbi:uncharacterized protein LOC62_02G002344 [Vanrija pseudolonga]|uniref:Uncharacterized protein n=1 Tax=Vanrija pseudolonga TaxID=143232 RepID=A0AAF1BFX0_9TREE|nr:hypothetical protein LOC62_02G002344 [Vanrija pseudolonga]